MLTHFSFGIHHLVLGLSLLLATTASALTSTELQQFIDEAIKAGGGEVVIPPGRHNLDRTLIIKDAKKLRIAGLDAETSILTTAAPEIDLIEIRGTSTDVSIEKLTLDGGRTAVLAQGTSSNETGPTGPRIANLTITRCFVQNGHGRSIVLEAVEDSRIEDCTIRDTSAAAIHLGHFTQNTRVRHNHLARSLVGIELNNASACRIEQNDLLACHTGIHLWRTVKQAGLNELNLLTANQIDHSTGNAIQLGATTTKNTLSANIITGAGKNGISLSGTGQILKANQITDSKLKDIAIQEGQHDITP